MRSRRTRAKLGSRNTPAIVRVRRTVLRWYRRDGRDLPWRRTRDAYAILVSEIMLQQTQVSRVVPKYAEFLRRFPTLRSLAAAPLRDVLRCWSGLGYNRRARRLWECARVVLERGGTIPRDVAALRALPGIGRYTAGAIASFAYGAAEPAVDTNIRRVLSRSLLGVDAAAESTVWRIASEALPRDAAEWNHALMDIGALFCRPKPACDACPLNKACVWNALNPARSRARDYITRASLEHYRSKRKGAQRRPEPFQGSRRQHRGRVVRALAQTPSMSLMQLGPQVKKGFSKTDLAWLHELLGDLERDGLVALNVSRTRVALP